jgi:hypothetical protein
MKLSELIAHLQKAEDRCFGDDPEVRLAFEQSCYDEGGFQWESSERITDIRLAADWPLPGTSVIVPHEEAPMKVVIFYDIIRPGDSSNA